MDPDAIKNLAECLRVLPWWTAILLCLVILVWRFFSWHDRKQERGHKDARADRYVGTIDALTQSLRAHETKEHERGLRLEATTREVQAAVRRCLAAVDHLSSRTRGAMSPVSSVRLIQAYYGVISSTLKRLVEDSLWEQEPAVPTPFVARKVRTLMAATLSQVRESLRAIPQLSVPVETFFPVYTEAGDSDGTHPGGERFYLVDVLWRQVEPFFSIPADGQDRAEAVSLLVGNTVDDYLSGIITRYHQENPEAFLRAPEEANGGSGPYSLSGTR